MKYMRRKLIVILIVAVFSSMGWAVIRRERSTQEGNDKKAAGNFDPQLAKFIDYKKWTLVNPVPALMDPASAALCAAIRPRNSPHANKYISVYVNDIGREAMMMQRK